LTLPLRIVSSAPDEPVIAVDGALGGRGLELSHWPGNRTPSELRHDLSTGSALAFARRGPARRAELAAGAVAVVNNHYDTDGICAMLAARHPDEALPRADRLLRAARAGDFFAPPDEDALALDALVTNFADPERSPLEQLADLDDHGRWERCAERLMEILPAVLDGGLAPWRALWEPEVAAHRADSADLDAARREDDAAADLASWTAARGAVSRRSGARRNAFDPGRRAFFGRTERDRVLVIGPGAAGTTYRLVISTLSWFDLVTRPRRPRPDLDALAHALNEREGTAPSDAQAWRAQPVDGASPELWFGASELERFAEHNAALAPSALPHAEVLRTIRTALAT